MYVCVYIHVHCTSGQYLSLDVDHNGMLSRDEIARQAVRERERASNCL